MTAGSSAPAIRAVVSPMYVARMPLSQALNSAKKPIANSSRSRRRLRLTWQIEWWQLPLRPNALETRGLARIDAIRCLAYRARVVHALLELRVPLCRMFTVVGHRIRLVRHRCTGNGGADRDNDP